MSGDVYPDSSTMISYVLRRVLVMIAALLGVTVIIFSLIQLAPGNIVDFYISANPDVFLDASRLAAMESRLGLDQSPLVQYFLWLRGFLIGDFGYSFETNRRISNEIAARIGATAFLFLASHLLAWPLAVFVGVLSATRPGSVLDHGARVLSLAGVSMPPFWISLLLILLFAVRLRWFPIGGSVTIGMGSSSWVSWLGDRVWHLVLPALAIAGRSIATVMRATRAEMLEVLGKDYIMSARAKGISERAVYLKHALRNALLPVVTLIGLSMGHIFSGAVLVETVFGWPGLGRYLVHAIHVRDYPAVMAVAVIASVMVLTANFLVDLSYMLINPRVQYE